MLEMLKNPPPLFAEAIRRHFYLKRDEVKKQVEEWIRASEKHATAMPNELSAMKVSHWTSSLDNPHPFQSSFAQLKIELDKLQAPKL